MSGGGLLSVGGFLAYQHGIYADLSVTGKGVRIRYPQGVTSLADAKLQLQGSQNNLLLSGDVLITRFTTSPDLDLAALAAQANASVQTIAPPDAPSNHVRLDVHIVSSPQLNFQNAFAKLAGDVDLRLRGTVASPSLLGRVSITEGSAMIAGTRYDLQRGDITFTNPVRIEPIIDLSATARVEDYDIYSRPARIAAKARPSPIAAIRRCPRPTWCRCWPSATPASQQRLYTQQQQQAIANPHRRVARRSAQRHRQQPRAKAVRRRLGQSRSQLSGRLRQLHLPHHRAGAVRPRPDPHLRHRRQHYRPAVAPGRSGHQSPCLAGGGPRRVRRFFHGHQGHAPLPLTHLTRQPSSRSGAA